ncbi:MAG: hypothetical protein QOJ00_1958 [Actinomycetota bacterium]
MGVSAIILLALGVPLAFAVHRSVVDQEVVEQQAVAAGALAEIDVPISIHQLRHIATEPDAPHAFAVYDTAGERIYGRGPRRADNIVRDALRGRAVSTDDTAIVVATPIIETGSEQVRGVLRLTESLDGAERRALAWYAAMVGAGVAALGLAWVIGNRLANTLAGPLSDLAAHASAIGEGGVLAPEPSCGIDEIDSLASVLSDRTRRVNDALQRERQFSADVSHQLRTPITALRLKLEQTPPTPAVRAALQELDRVEETIDHLLAVARHAIPRADEIRVDEVVAGGVARWQPAATACGRELVADRLAPTTARVSAAAVDQVLDVLIDNALRHGQGVVRVTLRAVAGGVAVEVADDGRSIAPLAAERLFERGHGAGTGLGLALARGIAEAAGGRLVLTSSEPTTFAFVVLS